MNVFIAVNFLNLNLTNTNTSLWKQQQCNYIAYISGQIYKCTSKVQAFRGYYDLKAITDPNFRGSSNVWHDIAHFKIIASEICVTFISQLHRIHAKFAICPKFGITCLTIDLRVHTEFQQDLVGSPPCPLGQRFPNWGSRPRKGLRSELHGSQTTRVIHLRVNCFTSAMTDFSRGPSLSHTTCSQVINVCQSCFLDLPNTLRLDYLFRKASIFLYG